MTAPPPKTNYVTHMMVRHAATMIGYWTDAEVAVGLEPVPMLINGIGTLVYLNLSYINICQTERPVLVETD